MIGLRLEASGAIGFLGLVLSSVPFVWLVHLGMCVKCVLSLSQSFFSFCALPQINVATKCWRPVLST